jgi:hypothetical protein
MKHSATLTPLFPILNIWCGFNLIIFLASRLPHWPNVSFHMWLNESIYFLLFLLSIAIALNDSYNRDVFACIAIYLIANALSFIVIFMGEQYLLCSNYSVYYWIHYKKIILTALLVFCILYLVLKYILSSCRPVKLALLTLLLVTVTFGISFYAYWRNPDLIFIMGEDYRQDLYRRLLAPHLFSIAAILVYGLFLYQKDRILGTYINLLMASLTLLVICGVVEALSEMYLFKIHDISQYIISINISLLSVVLMKKLCFISSDYGRFYEDLHQQKICLGQIPIQRYRSEINARLLHILKIYIVQKKFYLMILLTLAILILTCLEIPRYCTAYVIAILICLGGLFLYVNALYKKRARRKFILPIGGRSDH